MAKVRASDVGFCVVDDNANVIADNLVHRIREATAEMESQVNRLYRGRKAYDLETAPRSISKSHRAADLHGAHPARGEGEQSKVVYLQAAE